MTLPAPLSRLFVLLLALAGLAACSGNVSGPATVNDPTRITILPETATVFSGVATTFVISGGTGSYIVTSSNQAVIPVAGNISGNSLVITPNLVAADTDVTLSVRDTGTTPIANATVTVRPGTVSNDLTVTASSTQGLNCAPAICSGGDGEVVATLTQLGVPLAGRPVRFDAVGGDFRFVTSTSGSNVEILETTTTVVTDQTGRARARVRALPNSTNQTALLQATDTQTGSFQRTSFSIAQATGTSPGFFATPSSITFQGRNVEQCANTDISGTIYVFGGTPPYTVFNTVSTLMVQPTFLPTSGSGFTVTPTGACIGVPGVPITIRDAAGRTTSVNIANIPGTATIPALSASPSTVNLTSCEASANITIAGGRSNNYFVVSGSDALTATVSGNTVTVRRRAGPAAGPTGSIGISDGTSVVNVTVNLSGLAQGQCPTSTTITVSPQTVQLTDCTNPVTVTASGGSGTYSATSDHGSVAASVSGNIVSIRRNNPSAAVNRRVNVVVADSNGVTATIFVDASVAGAAACGGSTPTAIVTNPTNVTLDSCTASPTVVVSGGTGTYTASATDNGIQVTPSQNVLTIRRRPATPAITSTVLCQNPFPGSNQCVTVTDGTNTPAQVSVTVTPAGAGPCP